MSFDFPSSPTVGQQFSPVPGTTYTYNGYGWTSGGNTLSISTQQFIASGTYTPRVGMQFCIIECVGGGAGGGGIIGSNTGIYMGSGGGGSGGYSRKYATAIAIGASQTITIGTAGAGGAVGADGSAGGDTSVGTLCIAKGGSGGKYVAGALTSIGTGGAGGVAGIGDIAAAGCSGGNGGWANVTSVILGGEGGSSIFGGGAPGVGGASGQATNGLNASNYGSGGSGGNTWNQAATNSTGGAGSPGIVIITEYVLIGSSTVVVGVAVPPQGRLTLQSATPVMTTTQAAKTTIYYTPYRGNLLPIYDGTNFSMSAFSELSVLTTDTTKSPAAIGASKVNDWFVWSDAGTLRLGHGPDWTSDTVRSAGTALVMVNGIWLNNAAITNGPAAQRGTYVGTTRSNASSQLDFQFPGAAAGGTPGLFGVWNCYNRVNIGGVCQDTTGSWTYNSQTIRQRNASAGNQIGFVSGLQENTAIATINNHLANAADSTSAVTGIGVNSTTVFTSVGAQPVNTGNAGAGSCCVHQASSFGFATWSVNEATTLGSGSVVTFFGTLTSPTRTLASLSFSFPM